MNQLSLFSTCFLFSSLVLCAVARAQEAEPGANRVAAPEKPLARYTPTVKLIEGSIPAVASIQTFKQSGTPGVFNIGAGSGSVIHESGYLLTNDHVVNGTANGHVFLPGMAPLPFRTIASMSSEDMALIKIDVGHPIKELPLGRSDDLMLGEPVLVIGNPGGLTHSVSTGIVSGLNRSTATEAAFLPWMIQTSAAVSGGNSGGPLINALGEQIGIITSKKLDSENINFAIAVDRVREIFPRMLSAELRYAFRLGVEVDMYKPQAEVKSVAENSPAHKAGIAVGDVIVRVDEFPVRHGFDFHIALIGRKPGEKPKIQLMRGDESLAVEAELGALELAEPVAEEGMVAGLHFEAFTGQWQQLPDFDALTAVKTGRADTATESAFLTDDGENYGLRFSGFIKIPRDGLYTFYTSSDDGSRLRIGDEVVVNNDGLHGVMRAGGLVRLKAGLHPVTVTFFEAGGDQKLEVSYEGPELQRQTIPADAYFMLAPQDANTDADPDAQPKPDPAPPEEPEKIAKPEADQASANWPFTPIETPQPPEISDPAWRANPIDAFVRARLEAAGLVPSPALPKRALLRRLAFDLTGLPPTPAEVEEFVADDSPGAYEKFVDRYLASPRYGEHWARHWLDVVRYAETDGFAIDGERPTLWRYRDYVVRTFNEDRAFDQFIREQIAGDEIAGSVEGSVATGFYRLGPWEADNMTPEVRRQDYLNEVTGAVGAAFLGLTLECSRCHDHKYDPIPTRDYYRLQAFLASIQHAEVPADYLPAERYEAFDATKAKLDDEMAGRKEKLAAFRSELRTKIAAHLGKKPEDVSDDEINKAVDQEKPFTDDDKKKIRELTKAVETFQEGKQYASVAWTISNPPAGDKRPETFVLGGGDVAVRGERVSEGFLSAVPPIDGAVENASGRKSLAAWITHADHPLTARVLANRIWHYHFGEGIVRTANDFGRNGSGASHPEMLDYLAARLIDHGWQLKPLHREILLSQSYRLSTQHPNAQRARRIDPDNRLLWRGHYRRLEAETLRDAMLAASGRLRHAGGGPGFFEKLPKEMGDDFPFFKWNPSSEDERARRSLYMFQRRNMVHPMMESFDVADASESCAHRDASLHPLQAFDLLNGEFAHETARHFATRVQAEASADPAGQVHTVFALAFARPPNDRELEMGVEFLQRERGEGQNSLADFCLVVFNTNEFLYLE